MPRLDGPRPDGSGSDHPAEPAAAGSTPSAIVRHKEDRALVKAALERLGAQEREIIELSIFQGWSFRGIAAHLRVDESTVRYRFQRILESLGQQLKALE